MVISCFWAACMGGLIRYFADLGMHAFEVVFYRNFISLVLLLPWLVREGGLKAVKTTRLRMYTLRAVVGLIAMYFWFYALMNIPLADATALSFTAPLFTAVLAIIFFGERIGVHRISALLVGFAGVIIVLRPGTEVFQIEALSAVIAATFWAFSGVIIKTLTNTDKPRVVVFYMVFMMAPLSLPLAWPYLKVPAWDLIPWLIALGVTSNLFQIALSNAFAATEVNTILPFDFMRLVFVSIIAYIAFDQGFDIWTYTGAGVIMAGASYAAYREAVHNKKRAREVVR